MHKKDKKDNLQELPNDLLDVHVGTDLPLYKQVNIIYNYCNKKYHNDIDLLLALGSLQENAEDARKTQGKIKDLFKIYLQQKKGNND